MGDNRISKVAEIHYSYEPTSGRGTTTTGVHVLADEYENYIESANVLERIDHECFLHCINDGITSSKPVSGWKSSKKKRSTSVEARERENIDSGVILYRLPHMGESLDDHFEKIKIPFIMKYPVLGTNLDCTFVPDVWRDVMKRMVDFTLYLHGQRQSFADRLESRNFIMVADNLKFCNLRLQKSSNQSMKDDFIYIMEIIEKLSKAFRASTQTSQTLEEPHDLKDLFKVMKSYCSSRAKLLENHLAILSSKDRIRQIENFKSRQKQVQSSAHKQLLIVAMTSIINSHDWILRFKRKCQNSGPAYECFMHRSGENMGYREVGEGLLRFCRNMAVHLPDFFEKRMCPFGDIDIDLTIMNFFCDELLSFQWEASEKQMLAYLI